MHQDSSKRKNYQREKIRTASGGANGGETFPQLISMVHDLKMGRYSSEIVMKEMMAKDGFKRNRTKGRGNRIVMEVVMVDGRVKQSRKGMEMTSFSCGGCWGLFC